MIKIEYLPGSSSIIPAFVLLSHSNTPFQKCPVNIMSGRLTQASSAYPKLTDGDFSIVGGSAIALYLCDKLSLSNWYPSNAPTSIATLNASCIRAERTATHINSIIQHVVINRLLPIPATPGQRKRDALLKLAQDLSRRASIVENESVSAEPLPLNLTVDDREDEVIALLTTRARSELDHWAHVLSTSQYVCGEKISVADIVLLCALLPLNMLPAGGPDWLIARPTLAMWSHRIANEVGLPLYKECAFFGAVETSALVVGNHPAVRINTQQSTIASMTDRSMEVSRPRTLATAGKLNSTASTLRTLAEAEEEEFELGEKKKDDVWLSVPLAAAPSEKRLDLLHFLAHRSLSLVRRSMREISAADESLSTRVFSTVTTTHQNNTTTKTINPPAYTISSNVVSAADAIQSNTWVRVYNHNAQDGIVVMAKSIDFLGNAQSSGSHSGHCCYVTGEVRAPIKFVLDIIRTRRDKYDPFFNALQTIEDVTPELRIVHNRSLVREINASQIRTARFEFCLLLSEFTDEKDGATWISNNSVDHPSTPVTPGFVRAELPFAGWRLIPHPTDQFCCRVEFLMAFRSIGRLPSWFSPLHVAQFSEFVQRIRELCAGNE